MTANKSDPPVLFVTQNGHGARVDPNDAPAILNALYGNPDTTLWINVALTSATVVVACVGLIIAILAFFGYQSARRMLRREARKYAAEATRAYLDGSDFKAHVQGVVNDIAMEKAKEKIKQGQDFIDGSPKTEMSE